MRYCTTETKRAAAAALFYCFCMLKYNVYKACFSVFLVEIEGALGYSICGMLSLDICFVMRVTNSQEYQYPKYFY
jgi:hypothetical protein